MFPSSLNAKFQLPKLCRRQSLDTFQRPSSQPIDTLQNTFENGEWLSKVREVQFAPACLLLYIGKFY